MLELEELFWPPLPEPRFEGFPRPPRLLPLPPLPPRWEKAATVVSFEADDEEDEEGALVDDFTEVAATTVAEDEEDAPPFANHTWSASLNMSS